MTLLLLLKILQYGAIGSAIVQCIGYTFYPNGSVKLPILILNIVVIPSLISIVLLTSLGGNS